MLRKITKIILVVMSLGLIIYDFIPFFNPERGDTISEVICYYGLRSLTFPLVFGVLCGHFFLPVKETPKQFPKLLIGIGLFSIMCDVLIHAASMEAMLQYPIIPLVIGIPIGGFLWQQRRA